MVGCSKPAEQMFQTEDANFKMRRSFSWDRAFFTGDGVLDAEELSNMIEGGGNDEKHQLQKIEEIENLEAKLFQEIEASNKKSTGTSNTGKRDSQVKKVTGAGGTRRAALPVKTQPTRSSPSSCGSSSSPNVKSSATLQKRSITAKTGSKTPPGITTKNKVSFVNTRLPKTSPASPISPGSSGSSSSTSSFSVNQRSKRASSVPRRSTESNEKPSTNKGRNNNARKTDKSLGGLMPKTISSISLKNKPPPLNSHPLSPLGLSNSSPDKNGKQPALRSQRGSIRPFSVQQMGRGRPSPQQSKPGSPNDGKPRKLQPPKTVGGNAGLKPKSQKTTTSKPSKIQSLNGKEKRSSSVSRDAKTIFVMSPEVLDIKGKINALRMEINMQKKDRCIKAPAESVKGESGSSLLYK